MRDITIVAQGGGVIAAYHAGVVRAITERFGFDRTKRVIASSGAAALYAYAVSGQTDMIRPIWYYLFRSGRFVDPWGHKTGRGVIDIDFLVDDVIKKEYPLDLVAFQRSPVAFDTGLTETETGCSRSFPKDGPLDFCELLRASCAIPYFYGKSVTLQGRRYCDGTIGDVAGLLQIGSDRKVLIVLTRPDRPLRNLFLVRRALKWLLLRHEPMLLQEKIWNMPAEYNLLNQRIAALAEKKSVFVIRPRQSLPLRRIDMRVPRLAATIEQGYQDVMHAKDLDAWWYAA